MVTSCMMKLLTFFTLLNASLLIDSAKNQRNDPSPKSRPEYLKAFCEKLYRKCGTGRCSKCCQEFDRTCIIQPTDRQQHIHTTEKKRKEKTILENINDVNGMITGNEGLRQLAQPVRLLNGANVTLHQIHQLREVIDLKLLISGMDKMESNSEAPDHKTPFFAADVILTPIQARAIWRKTRRDSLRHDQRNRHKRHEMLPGNYINRWPRTIYYTFDRSIGRSREAKLVVRSAARYWNDNTCLNIVEGLPSSCRLGSRRGRRSLRDSVQDRTVAKGGHRPRYRRHCGGSHVVVVGSGGCASNLGHIGGAQAIHLSPGCQNLGVACREFGHTLGVAESKGCPGSSQSAAVPLAGHVSNVPSYCDVRHVNQMYCKHSCPGHSGCQNGGYSHPRDCHHCICPPQYVGPRCQHPCPNPPCVPSCPQRPCPPCKQEPCPPCPHNPCVNPTYPPGTQCRVSEWSSWSQCSVSCGRGTQQRARHLISGSGNCHEQVDTHDSRVCYQNPCLPPERHTDCQLSQWSSWSSCTVTCGEKCTISRNRHIIRHHEGSGRPCFERGNEKHETKTVELPKCPAVDCVPTPWSEWTHCAITCGDGCTQLRFRHIERDAINGGIDCGLLEESKPGELAPCPEPVDCEMGEWTDWSSCATTCGASCRIERSREVLVHPKHGGTACFAYSRHEHKFKQQEPCPIDCKMSSWSHWTHCTATCGVCEKKRFRHPVTIGQYGGEDCSLYTTHETESGNLPACPVSVDCEVSEWSSWSACERTCGSCQQTRTRRILQYDENGGLPCSAYGLQEEKLHQLPDCRRDCVLGEWSSWTACTATCGSCARYREKSILQEESYGGKPCADFCKREQKSERLPSCNGYSEGSEYAESRTLIEPVPVPEIDEPYHNPLPEVQHYPEPESYVQPLQREQPITNSAQPRWYYNSGSTGCKACTTCPSTERTYETKRVCEINRRRRNRRN